MAGGWSAAEARLCRLCAPVLLQIMTTVPTKLALRFASTPLTASRKCSRHDDRTSPHSLTERHR
eukprot:6203395-Pleurochrysis_carterae.AAC.1